MLSSETHTVLEAHFEPKELVFRVHDLTQGILQKNNYRGL